jgi:hypothetical protein
MGRHLDFYIKCMNDGKLPMEGLCSCYRYIDYEMLEDLFSPDENDIKGLREKDMCYTYWASEAASDDFGEQCTRSFGPLRQTIVLFMAAINDEL